MAFTSGWDETKPAGTRDVNLGDDDIREFKQQVRERLAIDHSISGTDDANTGYHKKVTLLEQGSDPASLADSLYLYAKLSGSFSELFTRHENAGVIQLTRLGKLWIESLGIASEAQGDILYYNGTIWTRLAAGTSGNFLKTQGAGANPAWADPGVVTVASQAEMETASATDRIVSPGRAHFHPGAAKAWCIFDGTQSGTFSAAAGYNVTNITKNSAGNYTITWTTGFSSANYAVCGVSGYSDASKHTWRIDSIAAGSVTIQNSNVNGTAQDINPITIVAFGDL